MEAYETGEDRPGIDIQTLAERVREVFHEALQDAGVVADGTVKIAARWEGGTLLLRPGREGLQEKEIPIESFFHKVVMARERLRVLEQ